MFQHADADDAVVLAAFGNEIAVVDEIDLNLILKVQGFNPFLALLPLFLTQRAAIAFDAVFLSSFDEEVAPAAADIEEGHSFFQGQFFQNIMDFIVLSLFQGIVVLFKVGAGIAHGRIEPFGIEIVAQIIVRRNLLLLSSLRFRRIEQALKEGFIQRELAVLRQEAAQGRKQIAFDFNVFAHISFTESQ